MPLGSGVMFAVATDPHGPVITVPPEKFIPVIGCPLFCGVWQSAHPPISARYSPRFAGVEESAGGTGEPSGSGAFLIKYFTGKIIWLAGKGFRTGGIERRKTTTDARSSSDML